MIVMSILDRTKSRMPSCWSLQVDKLPLPCPNKTDNSKKGIPDGEDGERRAEMEGGR
jgi:hypothetical protein